MTEKGIAPVVNQYNVGRIAERIVANELEARGFRVSDLNRDGLSANADLIAAGHKVMRQIQVKGTTNGSQDRLWWWQYGYCTESIIDNHEPMFNRRSSFYKADIVVLVAVRSPTEYRCIVLPEPKAEAAAQINLYRRYRTLTLKGQKRKPNRVWFTLEPAPQEHRSSPEVREKIKKERAILTKYQDAWSTLLPVGAQR